MTRQVIEAIGAGGASSSLIALAQTLRSIAARPRAPHRGRGRVR